MFINGRSRAHNQRYLWSPHSYNFSGNLSCCRCRRHSRQSGHRARPSQQKRYRPAKPGDDLSPPDPPITGMRSSPLCTAVRRRIFPAHSASPTSPAPAISAKKAWFRPQPHGAQLWPPLYPLPASPGRCNKRPGCVGASNHRQCQESGT